MLSLPKSAAKYLEMDVGCAEKAFTPRNIQLHCLESVIYNIGHLLGEASLISGLN
jgi:hypothetical protein